MSSFSYQEKSLYGSLAAELIVYVPYFVFMPHRNLSELVGVMAILIVTQIVLQSGIAAVTRNRLTDERDRLIALRGYRAGYLTLVSCFVLGLGMLWVHTALGQVNPTKLALHFLNVFFMILVLAEIVKTVTQLVAYRRANGCRG
jgi:hypothetical protein